MLDKLGEALKGSLKKISNALFIDETLINALVKDIQRSLLQSDVNVKLVLKLSDNIKKKFLKDEIPKDLPKKEYLIKVVYDELTSFLGTEFKDIDVTTKPFKIMLVGLFGSGKTTTSAKLGKYFKKKGYNVALLSTDTWRPAAFMQLQQLGKQINIDVYGDSSLKDPVKIYQKFETKLNEYDIVILDTAGRDVLNDELIQELDNQNKIMGPNETLLVMSADLGQAAYNQAEQFSNTVDITGVIITKLDGSAKGGGALSACSAANAPVKFIGVGEKVDDLEKFMPERFVGRLLGMGDLATLLEKVKDGIDEEQAQDMQKRILEGKFNLLDLYEQMSSMKKMGSLSKIMEMIPGFSNVSIPKDAINVQQEKLDQWEHVMKSFTTKELLDPDIIGHTRIKRVAKGSGVDIHVVRELIKQYRVAKKATKMLKGKKGNISNLMKKFGMKM